jgi:alanyl-tRNA synthetase
LKKSEKLQNGLLLFVDSGLGEFDPGSEYYLTLGDLLSKKEPKMVYVALFRETGRLRIMAFCGSDAQQRGARAGDLVKQLAAKLGGSGGGDSRFAQGGTPSEVAIELSEIMKAARELISR